MTTNCVVTFAATENTGVQNWRGGGGGMGMWGVGGGGRRVEGGGGGGGVAPGNTTNAMFGS